VSPEPPRRLHVVGAAIVEGGRVFLARRGPAMSMPGKWEFPGGKVEDGEAPEAALVREVAEELGIEIEVGRFLGRGEAEHAGRRIVLDVWLARRLAGEPASREHDAVGWFGAGELAGLDWPEADLPLLAPLALALGSVSAVGGSPGR
jgi:8-oxo-dGTP diphosphatase